MFAGMVPGEEPDEMNLCKKCGKLTFATNGYCRRCDQMMEAEKQAERASDERRMR